MSVETVWILPGRYDLRANFDYSHFERVIIRPNIRYVMFLQVNIIIVLLIYSKNSSFFVQIFKKSNILNRFCRQFENHIFISTHG